MLLLGVFADRLAQKIAFAEQHQRLPAEGIQSDRVFCGQGVIAGDTGHNLFVEEFNAADLFMGAVQPYQGDIQLTFQQHLLQGCSTGFHQIDPYFGIEAFELGQAFRQVVGAEHAGGAKVHHAGFAAFQLLQFQLSFTHRFQNFLGVAQQHLAV